jgi:PAS domain S-box-containing protein
MTSTPTSPNLTPLVVALLAQHDRDQARLRDLESRSAAWLWECDADLRCTYVSAQVEVVLGWAAAALHGQPLTAPLIPAEAERLAPLLAEIAAGREAIIDLQTWMRRGDGELACVRLNALPLLDDEARLLGYRGVCQDISEATAAAERRARHLRQQELLAELSLSFLSLQDFETRVAAALATVGEFLDLSRAWVLQADPTRGGWQPLAVWPQEATPLPALRPAGDD